MKEKFLKDVEYIIFVLCDAGDDPYEQLYAYFDCFNINEIEYVEHIGE